MNNLVIQAIESSPLNQGLTGIDWLAHRGNTPIVFENGDVALFDYEGEGTYEVHFLFKSRGREAIKHARESFRRMFEDHEATLIYGLVPEFRRDVKLLARWAGGKSRGARNTIHGVCELFVLSKAMWKKGNVQ